MSFASLRRAGNLMMQLKHRCDRPEEGRGKKAQETKNCGFAVRCFRQKLQLEFLDVYSLKLLVSLSAWHLVVTSDELDACPTALPVLRDAGRISGRNDRVHRILREGDKLGQQCSRVSESRLLTRTFRLSFGRERLWNHLISAGSLCFGPTIFISNIINNLGHGGVSYFFSLYWLVIVAPTSEIDCTVCVRRDLFIMLAIHEHAAAGAPVLLKGMKLDVGDEAAAIFDPEIGPSVTAEVREQNSCGGDGGSKMVWAWLTIRAGASLRG
eukprot:6187103-Pleurochrysis_carterae.AAC.1